MRSSPSEGLHCMGCYFGSATVKLQAVETGSVHWREWECRGVIMKRGFCEAPQQVGSGEEVTAGWGWEFGQGQMIKGVFIIGRTRMMGWKEGEFRWSQGCQDNWPQQFLSRFRCRGVGKKDKFTQRCLNNQL